MYCKNCGQEVNDSAVVCVHCGCSLEEKNTLKKNGIMESGDKHGLGILFSLILGLIGLIIGVCIYPSGSQERETFISGWIKGFIISIVIGIVLGVVYACSIAALL